MSSTQHHPISRILDRPIAYHRVFVTLTGSVTAAVMLSQALALSSPSMGGNWFHKTAQEWEEETGLTRNEQSAARKKLSRYDWWEEDLRKANDAPTVHYRIDHDGLWNSLSEIERR